MDYLEIPVLVTLSLPSSGAIAVHGMFGPALGIEVGCEAEGSSQGVTVSFECSELDVDTKTFDFGAMLGAGLSLTISDRIRALVDLTYNLGLTSIDDSDGDLKNRAFALRAGVGFSVGN